MQIQLSTPAECLLHRLLDSEKLMNTYQLSIEKEESCTSIFVCHASLEWNRQKPFKAEPSMAEG